MPETQISIIAFSALNKYDEIRHSEMHESFANMSPDLREDGGYPGKCVVSFPFSLHCPAVRGKFQGFDIHRQTWQCNVKHT